MKEYSFVEMAAALFSGGLLSIYCFCYCFCVISIRAGGEQSEASTYAAHDPIFLWENSPGIFNAGTVITEDETGLYQPLPLLAPYAIADLQCPRYQEQVDTPEHVAFDGRWANSKNKVQEPVDIFQWLNHEGFAQVCEQAEPVQAFTPAQAFQPAQVSQDGRQDQNLGQIKPASLQACEQDYEEQESKESFDAVQQLANKIQEEYRAAICKPKKEKKYFKCDTCDRVCTQKTGLINHIRTHTGERPFVCEHCGNGFAQKCNLTRHLKTACSQDEERRKHQCTQCSFSTYRSDTFKVHIKNHPEHQLLSIQDDEQEPAAMSKSEPKLRESALSLFPARLLANLQEKRYACAQCGKRFFYPSYLKQHMKTHTREQLFGCHLCSKRFVLKTDLNRHIMIHTQERPFACEWCPKRFNLKRNLKMHIRTHTGERPFECEWCPKKFKSSSHLKSHRHLHTGEKPFECAICGDRFRYRNTWKSHESKHELT